MELENGHLLIDDSSPGALFDSQQFILEAALHGADVSPPTRSFDTCHDWTYLLFKEFFHQGDCEKRDNVAVSFLCDRKTTSVPKSQPGFINFIVLPLFKQLVTVIPNCQDLYKQAIKNCETWSTYIENAEDKNVYCESKLTLSGEVESSSIKEESNSEKEETSSDDLEAPDEK